MWTKELINEYSLFLFHEWPFGDSSAVGLLYIRTSQNEVINFSFALHSMFISKCIHLTCAAKEFPVCILLTLKFFVNLFFYRKYAFVRSKALHRVCLMRTFQGDRPIIIINIRHDIRVAILERTKSMSQHSMRFVYVRL